MPKDVQDVTETVLQWKKAKADQEKLSIGEIRELNKKFKLTCDRSKREIQKLDALQNKPRTKTRSGRSQAPKRAVYSDGRWVNRGIDAATETFAEDEKDYLKKTIAKVRKVSDLKTEHLQYLVIYVLLEELKDIKSGKLQSDFHDKYMNPDGQCRADLQSEIRTSLFTNTQRDYISGLLQGAFQTTTKDAKNDIKHSEIDYVEIVMLYECIARIVRYVYDYDTVEEALSYVRKSSREAFGIDDHDDDDDDD